MARLTAEELEVLNELVTLDYLVENATDQWEVAGGVEFPTVGEWVSHYVREHMTKEQLRLVARHYLVSELSALQDSAVAEYHQTEIAEHDANGRSLIYPGPDGKTAYRDGYPVR